MELDVEMDFFLVEAKQHNVFNCPIKTQRPSPSQRRVNVIPGSLKFLFWKEHHQLHKRTHITTAQMTNHRRDIKSNKSFQGWQRPYETPFER